MSRKLSLSRWKPTSIHKSAADPALSWTEIGPATEHLAKEVGRLYWEGARNEIENIIHTLQMWRRPEYAAAALVSDNDGDVHGYDTFLGQVNQQARSFALRHREDRIAVEGWAQPDGTLSESAVGSVTQDILAEETSASIKAEVRKNLTDSRKRPADEGLAWLLLQAAGLLDIDQMIEERLDQVKPNNCPGIPQLVDKSSGGKVDIQVMECAKCHVTITGSMFTHRKEAFASSTICESCYWAHHYGDEDYIKMYKHALRAQTPQRISQAKYDGLLETAQVASPLVRRGSISRVVSKVKKDKPILGQTIRYTQDSSNLRSNRKSSAARARADGDVPLFFRELVGDNSPFDYVHVVLRVGPLVIEGSRDGAIVSPKDLPVYHQAFPMHGSHQRVLRAKADQLWQVQKPVGKRKHYKLAMKQVVGTPFSGLFHESSDDGQLEQKIVKALVAASQDTTGDLQSDQEARDAVVSPILDNLRSHLGSRLKIYIDSITGKLLKPTTGLTTNAGRSSLKFCSSLLEPALFGPLVDNTAVSSLASPLYLMSFACPAMTEYPHDRPLSRYDVPYGFTEEYLHRYYFRRYADSDIIDYLHEYWHDWGCFPDGPLYKYQSLFPWDCSEAWRSCPTPCGNCSIAKHVWAFPFDAWSMITLHLQREKHLYPPSSDDWVSSRRTLLSASNAMTRVAVAMAQSPRFAKSTAWLHEPQNAVSTRHPSLLRVRLGGIHRAQPFSHYHDLGTGDVFFVASWADVSSSNRVSDYKQLLKERMSACEIPWDLVARARYDKVVPRYEERRLWVGFLGRPNMQGASSGHIADRNYYP
ncbi:uncharacterized protein BDV17DRAFT_278354 [Aspergillus undulatus]|uniref:uncharacterized protein n=1 Tax=Aspergillus undulatus TaxID=1810928 RepID=UPI003CCE069B